MKLLSPIQGWWSERDAATRFLPLYIWRAIRNFGNYGSRRAAALAYYAVFSIFPLTLLLAITISRLVGAAFAQAQIAQGLAFFLPNTDTRDLLISNVGQALEQNTSFTLIALVGLIWAGLGVFSNVTSSLDIIFHVPTGRSMWRQRLIAVMMIVILVVLVTASFLTTGVLQLIAVLFRSTQNGWIDVAIFFVPLGLNIVIFVMLFRFVPVRYVYWDAVWPAAVFGAIGWELAKTGFRWYLTNLANYQVVYGGIATVIILLFWTYLLASIFLFSAELCAQLNEWIHRIHQPDALELYIKKPPPQLPE
ncbi:MAG: YihY/virulence factor BrkB family protein [Anaerolineae bacterium]|nr:YihY/virulence factor BrkB family protein [Anaerolineae bacterium]